MSTRTAAEVVRAVAARARHVSVARQEMRLASIRKVANIGRETSQLRGAEMLMALEEALLGHEPIGVPPPLLQLSGFNDMERPYTRLLGWLLDPERDHRAAAPALQLIAEELGFDALLSDLHALERGRGRSGAGGLSVTVEQAWPEGAGSTQEPDILIRSTNALLVLENKLWSGESGNQFGPYREALSRLAVAENILPQNARLHLLAPVLRKAPEGWGRTVSYSEMGRWLLRCAGSSLPLWDRALAYLVAESLLRDDASAERLKRAHALSAELKRRPLSPRDVLDLAAILPLPAPFFPGRTP
ncbi:MAG: PD-(D/E)XK nuclease family protein [Polyangiaceae bacterium]